ncbi:MAG TPA: hypothetical protein VKV26_10535 [Dehalococcoidia bacterium]|nr:hypothetical protein [Dehalococcoidia bacterium]
MQRATIVSAILLLVAGGVITRSAGTSGRLLAQQTPAPEDPALLRELAERELSPPPLPGAPAGQAQLLPGSLPDDLPLHLPLPEGSRLIGSVVRPAPAGGKTFDVVLDAADAPAGVLDFYRQALGELGWTPAPVQGPPMGGFVPFVSRSQTYCQGASGPALNLNAFAREGQPTDVRINIFTSAPGPCGFSVVAPPLPPGAALLPSLTPPSNVAVQLYGGRGGPGFWSSDAAVADTQVSVTDLHAAYAGQLSAAGWSMIDCGSEGPLAWSRWSVPTEGGWQGFLYVREGASTGQRLLHVEVVSTDLAAPPK